MDRCGDRKHEWCGTSGRFQRASVICPLGHPSDRVLASSALRRASAVASCAQVLAKMAALISPGSGLGAILGEWGLKYLPLSLSI